MCSKHVVNNFIFLVPLTPLTSCPTVPAFCSLIILGHVLGFFPPAIQQIVSVWRGISCCKLQLHKCGIHFVSFFYFRCPSPQLNAWGFADQRKGPTEKQKAENETGPSHYQSPEIQFSKLYLLPHCALFFFILVHLHSVSLVYFRLSLSFLSMHV